MRRNTVTTFPLARRNPGPTLTATPRRQLPEGGSRVFRGSLVGKVHGYGGTLLSPVEVSSPHCHRPGQNVLLLR